jgi:DNA-binding NtrC family response regulator
VTARPPADESRHVLVVDDEPTICRAVARFLERAGFSVSTAGLAIEAEAILRDRHVDVLVLDLRMPDARGDVLYHSAVALQPQLTRQTLFMTGDISQRALTTVEACGCPLLQKPFELRQLVELVRQLSGPALARERRTSA